MERIVCARTPFERTTTVSVMKRLNASTFPLYFSRRKEGSAKLSIQFAKMWSGTSPLSSSHSQSAVWIVIHGRYS